MQGTFAVLLVATAVTLIGADAPPDSDCEGGLIDGNGMCLETCPPGTILYVSDCITETMSQRTCRQPKQKSLGTLCDYTHCECVNGLLWDEAKSQCVRKDHCADQKKVRVNAEDIFV